MRLSPSLVITAICSAIGILWGKPYLWIPLSGFVASIIDMSTRNWVTSDDLGAAVNSSILLKFFFSLVGMFALLSMVICIVLLGYWVIT